MIALAHRTYLHTIVFYDSFQTACGDIYINLNKPVDQSDNNKVSMPGEWDLEMLFHQINNAFINSLSVSFLPEDRLLPFYLRANADVLHCKVGVLHVNGLPEGKADDIDYALIDFLGVSLKPQAYETSMTGELREDYAMLFTYDALRGNVKHVAYWVSMYCLKRWATEEEMHETTA